MLVINRKATRLERLSGFLFRRIDEMLLKELVQTKKPWNELIPMFRKRMEEMPNQIEIRGGDVVV